MLSITMLQTTPKCCGLKQLFYFVPNFTGNLRRVHSGGLSLIPAGAGGSISEILELLLTHLIDATLHVLTLCLFPSFLPSCSSLSHSFCGNSPARTLTCLLLPTAWQSQQGRTSHMRPWSSKRPNQKLLVLLNTRPRASPASPPRTLLVKTSQANSDLNGELEPSALWEKNQKMPNYLQSSTVSTK